MPQRLLDISTSINDFFFIYKQFICTLQGYNIELLVNCLNGHGVHAIHLTVYIILFFILLTTTNAYTFSPLSGLSMDFLTPNQPQPLPSSSLNNKRKEHSKIQRQKYKLKKKLQKSKKKQKKNRIPF